MGKISSMLKLKESVAEPDDINIGFKIDPIPATLHANKDEVDNEVGRLITHIRNESNPK